MFEEGNLSIPLCENLCAADGSAEVNAWLWSLAVAMAMEQARQRLLRDLCSTIEVGRRDLRVAVAT